MIAFFYIVDCRPIVLRSTILSCCFVLCKEKGTIPSAFVVCESVTICYEPCLHSIVICDAI